VSGNFVTGREMGRVVTTLYPGFEEGESDEKQAGGEKVMKSRLVAYGRIQKGRHARYLLVVLDERLRCAGRGDGSWWRRVLRFPGRRDAP